MLTSYDGFNCSSSVETAAFGTTSASPFDPLTLQTDASWDVAIIVDSPAPTQAFKKDMLTLAIHRLKMGEFVENDITVVTQSNGERFEKNRAYAAGIYFFVGVWLLSISWIAATLVTWLTSGPRFWGPLRDCCSTPGRCGYPLRPLVLWFILLFGIQQIVCWTGGFLGWIAIAAMQVILIVSAVILYLSLHNLKCRDCCQKTGTKCGCPDACLKYYDPPEAGMKEEYQPLETIPKPFGSWQRKCIVAWSVVFVICIFITIGIAFDWKPHYYKVWNRSDNTQENEFQPLLIKRTLGVIYSWDHLATRLRFNIFHKEQTRICGHKYTKILKLNSSRYDKIQKEFIHKYHIDMSIFSRHSYTEFVSANDWFTRQLHPNTSISLRPIAQPLNDDVVVSPADARIMVFDYIDEELNLWIKGNSFKIRRLLNIPSVAASRWKNGSLAIVRLAPQDYHRFHAPVSGEIFNEYYASGTIFSVSADAMTSRNDAQYNQRVITIIDTGDRFGQVAMVSIGATCVGSIHMNHRPGYVVRKGQEMGYFQFGGSTNILVFEPGKIEFAHDIKLHSSKKVETFIRVGQEIARKRAE